MIQIVAGLAALVVLFFLVVIIRDVNRFVTIEYHIPCKGLKRSYSLQCSPICTTSSSGSITAGC